MHNACPVKKPPGTFLSVRSALWSWFWNPLVWLGGHGLGVDSQRAAPGEMALFIHCPGGGPGSWIPFWHSPEEIKLDFLQVEGSASPRGERGALEL